MNRTHSLAALATMLMFAACDDGGSTRPEDERPFDDELLEDAGSPNDDELEVEEGEATDGTTRDAGTRRDGGTRRDAGTAGSEPDATVPAKGDAAVADSATPPASSGEVVPTGDHCAAVAGFDEKATAFEDEVLKLTNEARAVGFNCDAEGNFGPTTPLRMQPQLRCSSRLHSAYMAKSGDFAHTQKATGDDPFVRMMAAGYKFSTAGENIAAGQPTPKSVVDGWLKSDGHCANIMNPSFTEIGVGYVAFDGKPPAGSYSSYWTQNFGKPRK